jgi:hypothetical protein
MTKATTIVGDKFGAFARNPGVICIGELEEKLKEGKLEEDIDFDLGQGVSDDRVARLLALATVRSCRHHFLFERREKCGFRHVHKNRPENSMLSLPRRISESRFEADLLVDDAGELMSDHVSGQHLPGMVLIEASRQMIMAVTEEFFPESLPGQRAFVWLDLDVKYSGYAFPVRTTLSYDVHVLDTSKRSRVSFTVGMTFHQGSVTPCSTTSQFELYAGRVIEKLEQRLASAAVFASP